MTFANETPTSPICYVPSQPDPLAAATKRALKASPVQLFFRDVKVLFRQLRLLPWLFLPFPSKAQYAELSPRTRIHKSGETVLQVLLFVLETTLLLTFIPTFILLPGSVSLPAMILALLLIYLISLPMSGPATAKSKTETKNDRYQNERWVFINGCASGRSNLQGDIDTISGVFGRPVLGIHNRTFGLVADIAECLIQRVFDYKTTDVRVAYEQVKSMVYDPNVDKVVLIGHSQGGIVISLVVDQLLTEVPQSVISKLEICELAAIMISFAFSHRYFCPLQRGNLADGLNIPDTFGSAAAHFSNPPLSLDPLTPKSFKLPKPQLLIPHIEQ